jgi:hypothetical protein
MGQKSGARRRGRLAGHIGLHWNLDLPARGESGLGSDEPTLK